VLQPSLVGRGPELGALGKLVRDVRRGGGLAVVEGEAGIGKTRVVEATVEAALEAGVEVLTSSAEELESRRPCGAIVDCIGREPLEAHLGPWEPRPDTGGERQFRIAETVLEVLDDRCARGRVLLAIEDLHWADPATLGVLVRVAAGIERLPAALLVSTRTQPRRPELERLLGVLAARGATTLRLGPLDERASVELVQDLVGARPRARLVEQAQRAGGHPLFICEMVGALMADGAIVRGDGDAELATDAVAAPLALTMLHRLSYLEPEVLDLLGLASVLGASFAATDLALLARRPVAELVPTLRAARQAGVIGEHGDRLAFRHELMRDALYEDMPLSVRRGLHAELARALADAGEPAERIAEHVLRGAEPGDERAVGSVVAAARALVVRSPSAAVDLYRHAIALSAAPDARREELLPELAQALVAAGLLEEGEAACHEALALGLDADWAGRLWLHLMFLLARRGRTAETVRTGEAALAAADLHERDRVRIRALVAMARVFEGEVAPAVEEAGAVVEASADELARALANNTLAIAADARGAFAEAADLMAPGVRWAERTGSREAYDARPHMILGLMLARLDRFADAQTTIQHGRRGAEALGIADALPVFHYQLAYVNLLRGRLDDALAELATRAQLAEETHVGWNLSADSVYALIALHRDDLAAAERRVAAAEQEAAAGAPPFGLDLMVLARALLLEAAGDAAPALAPLAATFAAAPTFQPAIGPDLARLAAAADEPEAAAGVPEALERIAGANPGARSLQAAALRARGLLERDPEALLSAHELMLGTGRALECARAAEDAAAALSGDRRALDLLASARDAYERAGAIRDLARVDAAQRALGIRRGVGGPRRRPSSGWEALTETELKVVRLVAERLTNPEIAERMFISRRTVQTHVSHALAKLGVDSRRALAAEAARRAGWRIRVEGVGEQAQQPEPSVEAPADGPVDLDEA
jgi:DNA-binding CsgD family transcriptional regulator